MPIHESSPRLSAAQTDPQQHVSRDGRALSLRNLSTLLPPAVLFGSVLHLATAWGTGHKELLTASLVVIFTQLVPGVLIWRSIRPAAGWLVEDLALGLAIGAALAVPSQVAAVWMSAKWIGAALPILVCAVLLAVPTTRVRILRARHDPLPWAWGLAVTVTCLLPVVNAVKAFREPVRWTGWATPYVDFPYHLALSGELAHRFPLHYPQVAGDTLYYHWFAHAWVAQVSNLSGAPLDVVLMRYMPALLAVAVPLALAVATMRVARSVWAGPLAAAVAFAVVDFDVWGFGRLPTPMAGPLSPTQGFGLLLLIVTVAVLRVRWCDDGARGTYALLLPLLVVVGGSKGSMLPVLVVGMFASAAAAMWWRAPHRRRILLDTFTALVVLTVLMKYLFGGGVGGTKVALLEPLVAARGEEFFGAGADITGLSLGSFVVLAMLPTFLGAIAALKVVLGRETRRDPLGWMLAGCSIAGAGAIMTLDHPGMSQYYFLRTAEAPLSILTAWGLVAILKQTRAPGTVLLAGTSAGIGGVLLTQRWPGPLEESVTPHLSAWAAVVVFLCVASAMAVATALRISRKSGAGTMSVATGVLVVSVSVAGFVPMIQNTPGEMPPAKFGVEREPGAVHSSEVRAARWIRDHSEPDELVMTNQHCRTGRGPTCDHRRFYVAAYSERGVLLEGWAYTKTSNALGAETGEPANRLEFWDPELLSLNDGFLASPNARDAAQLFDLGVRWAFVDDGAPHADDLAPFATERFRAGSVRVYELLAPQRVQ